MVSKDLEFYDQSSNAWAEGERDVWTFVKCNLEFSNEESESSE